MPRITSISPGGRYVGIASFHGEALLRAEVLSLRACRSAEDKLGAFTEKLRRVLDEDRPDVLVVEALRPIRSTNIARSQAERAAHEATERGLGLDLLDLRSAKEALVGRVRFDTLRAQLAAMYPETWHVLGNPDAEPRRVRQLAAAVAIGLIAARKLGATDGAPTPALCTPSDPPAGIPA